MCRQDLAHHSTVLRVLESPVLAQLAAGILQVSFVLLCLCLVDYLLLGSLLLHAPAVVFDLKFVVKSRGQAAYYV